MRISDWSSDVCFSDLADLGHHFQVELGALCQPLCLDQLVLRVELLQPLRQLLLDRVDRVEHGAARGDVVRLRVDGIARQRAQRLAGERSEEHTSELQSLMRISYAVFCLKKKKKKATRTKSV